jgi:hypothetical protein
LFGPVWPSRFPPVAERSSVSGLPRPLALAAAGILAAVFGVAPSWAAAGGAQRAHEGNDVRPRSADAAPSGVRLHNFTLVGHNSLGDFRDYGDVWGHGDAAYVGSRCGGSGNGGAGVPVVDISDPGRPRVVSRLSNPKYSRAEDVVVRHIRTPWLTGDLAAVGIQQCFAALDAGNRAGFTGIEFFDVTRPARPIHLSTWRLPRGTERTPTIGCHEIDLVQAVTGRVLAGCARNLVDQDLQDAVGVHFIDVTDPAHPRQVSTFSLDVPVLSGVGALHSSSTTASGSRTAAVTPTCRIGTPAPYSST